MSTLREWVKIAKEHGASDLLLEAGTPLVLRVRGELAPVGTPVTGELLLQTARELLAPDQWDEFLARRSYDLSLTLSGVRCRINVFQSVRGICFAIRLLSSFQNNLRDCNLLPDLRRMIEPRSGLVIISGPTGSGKSTTLAALIEEINATQAKHVIAIESPIEYFFQNRRSYIRQREVPTHSPSFEQAIIDSMRENPDVMVIGEMRTADVMRLSLNAAETGHLVLATMHSSTCAEAIARLCMSFSSDVQGSVRSQIADCLVGVVCQRLTYLPQYQIRVPQLEIMTATSGVRSHIRSGNFSQIISALQTGADDGMWTFERYRQRWIEQNRDWVKPAQATPLAAEEKSRSGSQELPPARFANETSITSASTSSSIQLSASRPAKTARSPERVAMSPQEEGRIEIGATEEEEDLEALARRIAGENSDTNAVDLARGKRR